MPTIVIPAEPAVDLGAFDAHGYSMHVTATEDVDMIHFEFTCRDPGLHVEPAGIVTITAEGLALVDWGEIGALIGLTSPDPAVSTVFARHLERIAFALAAFRSMGEALPEAIGFEWDRACPWQTSDTAGSSA